MNKILLRRIFPLLAVLLLAPWPVAYAYDNGAAEPKAVQVTVAETSAAPSAAVFGGAISGVTPGDLFYIDAAEKTADIWVTLYLTNAQELVRHYRYIILKVGVYAQGGTGQWDKASGADGQPIRDTFITMLNGQVSFSLPGNAKYKLTIDGGSFNSFPANGDQGNFAPQFYLEAD